MVVVNGSSGVFVVVVLVVVVVVVVAVVVDILQCLGSCSVGYVYRN